MTTLQQLTRLLIIIRKIKSGKCFSKKELLDVTNLELKDLRDYSPITERTIERDLKVLRDAPFNLMIIYTKQRGYEIEKNDYVGLDIEQLLEPFDILNALNADSGLQDIIITEKYSNKGTEYLIRLIRAIRNSHRVSFEYKKYLQEDTSKRILEPYAIKLLKGQWYVVGKMINEVEIKTFALDRISDFIDLKQKFKKDKEVDIRAKFENSFGIYSSEIYPVEDVILSFDKSDGSYLKTVPLHHSQEIIEETETTITLKLKLRITEDFVMAILSRSWSVKVIQPVSLKQRVCNIYLDALKRNGE